MSRTRSSCPTCGRELPTAPASPWRPFCSDRCRLLDLGAWLDGRRAIPAERADPAAEPAPPEDQA